MVKAVQIKLGMVFRILDFNDVLPQKRLVRQEILPVFGLDVQLLDGLHLPKQNMFVDKLICKLVIKLVGDFHKARDAIY